MIKMNGECSMHGEMGNVSRILVGKPEWKRPLRKLRHRWRNNIEVDFEEMSLRVWIRSIWLRIGSGFGLLWTW
jgi:hypothetical protein